MDPVESIKTTPLNAPKSVRTDTVRSLTSAKAGKIHPLFYMPLLREDRVARGKATVTLEMAETPRPLMNAVNVEVNTYFVPFLALPHFEGSLDQLNRSYQGQPQVDGGSVKPFFPTETFGSTIFASAGTFLHALGIHVKAGTEINVSPLHAYNALVNWRYRARSKNLTERLMNDTSLATCFWRNGAFSDVVSDFDQAKINGELDLAIASASLPVKGIGMKASGGTGLLAGDPIAETGDASQTTRADFANWEGTNSNWFGLQNGSGIPAIYAELQGQGVTLNLSNIDMAKKTAAFAEIRKEMNGIEDDYIIDLLMSGIRVPDEMMRQPILLDRKRAIFGYSERYATDAANLDTSVTQGRTTVEVNFRTPPMNTGGIIICTAEIVPEQLFERQKDHFLHTTDTASLPETMRDMLDPEKVRVVTNDEFDVQHSVPTGTGGYAPLNSQWKRKHPTIGGKFYRQIGDVFSEDRQRIWEVEQTDPALNTDFYLATNIHHDVFSDTLADPFEIVTVGGAEIVGNTVFGKQLDEDTGDYLALEGTYTPITQA